MRDATGPRRIGGGRAAWSRGAAGCAAVLLAAACTPTGQDGTYRLASAISNAGVAVGAPWGGMTPASPEEGLTINRVEVGAAPPGTLLPEPGDVWPGPLPPRATLANPDAALRGIPDYAPSARREGIVEPPATPPRRQPPFTRGSSTPPDLFPDPPPPAPAAVPPLRPPQPLPAAPPPRADGRVILTPSGPAVTTGGTDRIQSFTVPGVGGTGTAIRDGNTTLMIGPDGRPQTVLTPPR